MSVQFSVARRNAMLDAAETSTGTDAILRLFSGSKPANCATASSGTLLLEMTLPSDWLAAASNGAKAKAGTWQGNGHANAGAGTNAGYYRIFDSAGTTCHEQGDVSGTGGGAEMELDNISIASGQQVTISSYQITAGNA